MFSCNKIKVWWSSLLEHCPSEERMMETMIPPQVGMRLRTKNKKRGHKKEKSQIQKWKNERKREKGQCYYPFTTLVLQNSTMIFIVESLSCYYFPILVGIFYYKNLACIFQQWASSNALGLREQASWMHTHLVGLEEPISS